MMTEAGEARGTKVLAVLGPILALILAAIIGDMAGVGKALPFSGLLLVIFLLFRPLVGIPVLVVLLVLAYLGWFRPAWTGKVQFTSRTWVGLFLLYALSACWYWAGWAFGMEWEGAVYTVGCVIIGAALFLGAVIAGVVGRKPGLAGVALFGRWLALVWAVTYGYPWLGELP